MRVNYRWPFLKTQYIRHRKFRGAATTVATLLSGITLLLTGCGADTPPTQPSSSVEPSPALGSGGFGKPGHADTALPGAPSQSPVATRAERPAPAQVPPCTWLTPSIAGTVLPGATQTTDPTLLADCIYHSNTSHAYISLTVLRGKAQPGWAARDKAIQSQLSKLNLKLTYSDAPQLGPDAYVVTSMTASGDTTVTATWAEGVVLFSLSTGGNPTVMAVLAAAVAVADNS